MLTVAIPDGVRFQSSAVKEAGFVGQFKPIRHLSSMNRAAGKRIGWAAEFPNQQDELAVLLWAPIANEMGVKPTLGWIVPRGVV
ncbi:hypothetical protein [Paracoccus shanxieyensis]|uniref:Uncharacterized protein n=1 Tax=Paracoccus shanxieyensis TaxID=2675752 RepID=A0A6L6IZJ2_9RHOB|nr:hypothetical protein [Paracoccus shanxieyensis]MTH65693.1 hypothetical protein [Paracoccus shanxieyensis]MTH88932.1 hypothetical protein [Paracoccus shanxieyensis]